MLRDPSRALIDAVRPATQEEWDEAWRGCSHATYFQSREWAEIWADSTGGRLMPAPLHVRFVDGATAVVPSSMERRCRGLVPRFHLSPAGTFGGGLSVDPLSNAQVRALGRVVLSRYGTTKWRLNPYDETLASITFPLAADDETHVLDLSHGFEAVSGRWKKGQRSSIRKAERSGVTVDVARSRDEWQSYYAAYRESVERWGENATSTYSWELFDLIRTRHSPNVRLWVASHDGEVVAGALCFYASEHAVYWSGAARSASFSLRPVNLLIAEAIRHACESGFRWFDFNPSGGHEGVTAFKRTFGTERRRCPVVTARTPGAKAVEAGLRALGAA